MMTGKVCIITGATSGLGAATAEGLARLGATVVGVGRDRVRCDATKYRIRNATGNQNIDFMTADLSSQNEIRRFADEFQLKYTRLDVLINNVGGIFLKRMMSVDDIELTFALNHLGPFLLTDLLLELLKSSVPARVVNVSSCGHDRAAAMNFDDLEMSRGYRGFPAYFQSKLANLMFTYELARRLEDDRVTVNAVDPGLVATDIGRNNGWVWRTMKFVYDRYTNTRYATPEQGARTAIYVASSSEVENTTGKYFVDERIADSSDASRDQVAAARLWAESENLTGRAPRRENAERSSSRREPVRSLRDEVGGDLVTVGRGPGGGA
jgi:retinol dehydrogenase 14